MRSAYVAGLGFWAPGFGSASSLVSGRAEGDLVEPACALVPPRLARRASLLTRMFIEVASQAGAGARADLALIPTVFATARGEMEVLSALLEMLHTDGELSPTRFHQSTYNAAGGCFSIAMGNRSFSTTIAAGGETVAMALLEALCVLEDRPGSVLVAFGDEEPTVPFLRREGACSMAAALCLTSERPRGECFGRVAPPWRGTMGASSPGDATFYANPVAPAATLIRALHERRTGALPISVEASECWYTDLLPTEPIP